MCFVVVRDRGSQVKMLWDKGKVTRMKSITLADIQKSNKLKKQICNNCKEQLKGTLSKGQLEKFEGIFYSAVDDYILQRKDSANGNS